MYQLSTSIACLLGVFTAAAVAAPGAPPAVTASTGGASPTYSVPAGPCNTFVARARNGTYAGMYLGPSDPLSLEISNATEAARFAIYPGTGTGPGSSGSESEPEPGRRLDGRVEILPEHDVWITLDSTHSGVLWDDTQGRGYGAIRLACRFPLPLVAAGRLRCTTPNDERVFYTCPQSGSFLGVGVDEHQYPGCQRLELEGIPTCFHK